MWKVLGQAKTIAMLDGAWRSGHLAHAYLLVGPSGVGKRTLALNLAQALNCTGAEPPCGECRPCQRIISGKHSDVRIITLKDEKSSQEGSSRKEISIDEIKQLQIDASLPPFEGRRKVFIIDGAEYLSQDAANRLLKTLEEPPAGVVLLLLAAREDRLLPTVVSRCQKIEMLPLSPSVLEAFLRERGIEARQARMLSRLSQGCPGWALSALADNNFLEQYFQQLRELLSLEEASLEKRFALAARMAVRFQRQREKVEEALDLWLAWWHDLLLMKNGVLDFISNVNQEGLLRERAQMYRLEEIRKMITSLREARKQLEWNANPRLVLEVLMLELPGLWK